MIYYVTIFSKCNNNKNVEYLSQLLTISYTGGPLVTEELDGTFTLVGILSGGGLECSQLGNSNYNWQNKTGKWMRVAAFRNYIDSLIFQETLDSKRKEIEAQ